MSDVAIVDEKMCRGEGCPRADLCRRYMDAARMPEPTYFAVSPVRPDGSCTEFVSGVACSCYGCAIARQRAGIPAPDRSAASCNPPGACASHGQCWTHSEWVDEARCDPPGACASRTRCAAHDEART